MTASAAATPSGGVTSAPIGSRPETARRLAGPVSLGLAAALGSGLVIGPVPLVLGLAALALVIGALWQPELATIACIFVLFANLLAVATKLHGAPTIAGAGFILILAVPLLHQLVICRRPIVVTTALLPILGYLTAMLVAAAASATVTAAVGPVGEFLVEGLLLYLLVSNVVRTPATLRRAIWAIVLAGGLMGSLSLLQEVTHSYDNDFGGLAQVNDQGFKVGEDQNGTVLRPRSSGPIGEQNRYAQILLIAVPLAVFRALHEEHRRLRTLAAVCGLAMLAGILLTFSRGAAVAVAATFALLVVRRHIRLRQAVIGLCLLGGAVVVIEPDYVLRLSSLARAGSLSASGSGEQADGAVVGRATSNLAAWDTFVDHPVTGVGPGRYFVDYSQAAGNELNLRYLDENRRAHNLYLEVAADLGLPGIAALLTAVGVTAAQLSAQQRYWRSRRPDLAALASSLLFALFAYMSSAVFLHLAYQRYFWLLLALANATSWTLASERRAGERGAAV